MQTVQPSRFRWDYPDFALKIDILNPDQYPIGIGKSSILTREILIKENEIQST